MFDVSKLKRNVSLTALAVGAGIIAVGSPAMAFDVDGRFDAGEGYTATYAITTNIENSSGDLVTGTLMLGREVDDLSLTGSVYAIINLGSQINDNSYGTGVIGWEGTGKKGEHKFDNLRKSDFLELTIGDQSVIIDYLSDNTPYEAETDSPAIGLVKTSLQYNIENVAILAEADGLDPKLDIFLNSPTPGVDAGVGVSDQERYDSVTGSAGGFQHWEYDIIYEFEIVSDFYDTKSLADIASDILDLASTKDNPSVHFSPHKLGENNEVPICKEDTIMCVVVPPDTTPPDVAVSEPGTLAVFGFGLLGLGALQRRRRNQMNSD